MTIQSNGSRRLATTALLQHVRAGKLSLLDAQSLPCVNCGHQWAVHVRGRKLTTHSDPGWAIYDKVWADASGKCAQVLSRDPAYVPTYCSCSACMAVLPVPKQVPRLHQPKHAPEHTTHEDEPRDPGARFVGLCRVCGKATTDESWLTLPMNPKWLRKVEK